MTEKSSKHNELMRKRISNLMDEYNLSKPQLSRDTGISEGGIKYILNKECNPTAHTISILCNYFGVSTDYLFGNTDKRK